MVSEIKRQTAELFARKRQIAASGWLRVRNQIALLNNGLVEKLASKYAEDGRESFEDLCQVGMIGLLKAVDKFDPARGAAFSSYAVPFIRGEILHHRRDKAGAIKIPRSWSDRFNLLRQLLDDGASHGEMARACRIPEDQIPMALDAMLRPGAISLDAPLATGVEECWEVADDTPILTDWSDLMAIDIVTRTDGFVDAVALCQHHKRKFTRYWRLKRTETYRLHLKRYRIRTGPTYEQTAETTWVCPELALDVLRWCSPAHAVAIDAIAASRR